MSEIMNFLLSLENIKVRRSFSSKHFSLIDKTPIITVSQTQSDEKSEINGSSVKTQKTLVLRLYTHKSEGGEGAFRLCEELCNSLKTMCQSIKVSETEYVEDFHRFLKKITLILEREVFETNI